MNASHISCVNKIKNGFLTGWSLEHGQCNGVILEWRLKKNGNSVCGNSAKDFGSERECGLGMVAGGGSDVNGGYIFKYGRKILEHVFVPLGKISRRETKVDTWERKERQNLNL